MFLYVLISDLSYIVKSRSKYFIIYIISLLVYLLFKKNFGISGYTLLTNINGIEFMDDIISKLIFILNQIFIVFITYSIFIKDFKISADNIFLRTTIKKWLIIKIFSVFIIIFLVKLFIFLFMLSLSFIIKYDNFQLFNLLKLFLNYLLYLLFFQSLSILFMSLIYIGKLYIFPLFIFCLAFLKQIFIPMQFNNVGLYLIFSTLIIFILEEIYIKKFIVFFERSNV